MEWQVVTVIITLIGLIAGVAKPIINLTSTIATLTKSVETLEKNIGEIMEKNSKSHERLWEHNEEQDAKLHDHDKRIVKLEEKK